MKDDNEIIEISCDTCGEKASGTYKELFGELPSLVGLPKMKCKCGGNICLDLTGEYGGLANSCVLAADKNKVQAKRIAELEGALETIAYKIAGGSKAKGIAQQALKAKKGGD